MNLQIDAGIDETTIGVLKIGENHVLTVNGQPTYQHVADEECELGASSCEATGASGSWPLLKPDGTALVSLCSAAVLTFDVINDEYPVINIPWISIVPWSPPPPPAPPPPPPAPPPPFPPNQTPIWRRPKPPPPPPYPPTSVCGVDRCHCKDYRDVFLICPGEAGCRLGSNECAYGETCITEGAYIRAGMCSS